MNIEVGQGRGRGGRTLQAQIPSPFPLLQSILIRYITFRFNFHTRETSHISRELFSIIASRNTSIRVCRGCPGVPVHGGIPIVFISIHGVVTQFVNVSFLCVPVHEDTTSLPNWFGWSQEKIVSSLKNVWSVTA